MRLFFLGRVYLLDSGARPSRVAHPGAAALGELGNRRFASHCSRFQPARSRHHGEVSAIAHGISHYTVALL